MALRGKPLTIRPKGACDAIDGTNAFKGAMAALTNLVPSPTTDGQFVPRPAATTLTGFTSGFTNPQGITALFVLGSRIYGMISTSDFAGKDIPFCYDVNAGFIAISGVANGNTPTTQSTSGDWTPPTMAMIGQRIVVTHPGFAGSGINFGWIDVSNYTSTTLTGNTHSNTVINGLSADVLTAGWEPGMTISDSNSDIPGGTTIVSIASDGLSLVISQNATGSHMGTTFTVSGGTTAAPLWAAGDANGNPLGAIPVAVANFNGRAYYAVNNTVVFSDSLNATQVTNASQVLTLGDDTAVTALAGLPLSSSTQGGIIQSLIAFKGDAVMFQIMGDAATSNLTKNELNVSVGTLAPNTICATPLGLAFVAPDGLRIIDFSATVSDPIGANGKGICNPFLTALNPTRMCAAFNQNTLRISVQNGSISGQPYQEWWLDFDLKIWTGPHTFPATLIEAYQAPMGASSGHGFIMAPVGIVASLWESSVTPTLSSTYVENSTALSWAYQTVLLPDNLEMAENSVIESTIGLAMPATQTVSIFPQDEQGDILDTVNLVGTGGSGTTWGNFQWGNAAWGVALSNYQQYQIPWAQPLVFKQMSIRVVGSSQAAFSIGNIYLRYEVLGYLLAAGS